MSSFATEQALVQDRVAQLPGWNGRRIVAEPALAVLASPSWRGVDGAAWRVLDPARDESLFVKVMDADAGLYIDVACAFAAAERAGAMGIGPHVIAADADAGILIMQDLNVGWRVGTLERMLDPAVVDAVLAARRRFQDGPPLPRRATVFEEIARFHAACRANDAQLPSDADWLVAELGFAGAPIAALPIRPVPIHGDGNVSNILISDAGEVRLVDWDRATTADPLEDLGSFLVEACAHEPEARDIFARATGGFDEATFNRCRLYGIADDLRWGLIGALVAARSPRVTHEFYKFANWRFLRCRMAVREARFGEAVRRLA